MAGSDLKFNNYTICDISEGDIYNLTEQTVAQADVQRIIYPNTAGAIYKIMGSQQAAETAESYTFEGIIFKESESALRTVITNMENYMTSDTHMISDLDYATPNTTGTQRSPTDMKVFFEVTSPLTRLTASKWFMRFRARFIKATV